LNPHAGANDCEKQIGGLGSAGEAERAVIEEARHGGPNELWQVSNICAQRDVAVA
jgi:hypothetical protein